MLRRSTKIQLLIFVVITLLGVSYVSAEYVGLFKGFFGGHACTVSADFPDSGGIFTNAEVTYRGVDVGRVGQLHLIPNGVRVDLSLSNCTSPEIPQSSVAEVSDLSVIGEQYVNLIPPNGAGPYLRGGQVLPMSRNKIPLPPQTLLADIDRFVNSIDTTNLRVLVAQLGQAFNDEGPALASLLDSSNNLLLSAQQNLPDTLALIRNADPVLQTQLSESASIATWAHNLNLLSQQLKASNTDISNLLTNGPSDLSIIGDFVTGNQTDLGVTLNNLASTGQLIVRRQDGLEELFELYPALAAGTYTVLHPDGVGYLGFVVDAAFPPDCGDKNATNRQGYGGTPLRAPSNLSPSVPNSGANCNAPTSSGEDIRGAQNAPGGDPISTPSNVMAYPRVTTGNTVRVGSTNVSAAAVGDDSWTTLLTNGLH